MRYVEQQQGAGVDYYADTLADPEDTLRLRITGDTYPRVELSPRGGIKTGPGTSAPLTIGVSARAAYSVLDAGLIRTTDPGYNVSTTGAVNTFLFAILVANHANEACDFVFPPGTYDTVGFTLYNPGHRIVGAGGAAANQGDAGRGTRFIMRAGGNPCVRITGTDTTRYYGLGMSGVYVSNSSSATLGIVAEHLTHFQFDDVWVSGFRGAGGGFRFADAMDGALYDCCVDFCGSADGSNLASVLLTATDYLGAGTQDACNEIRFIRNRFENNSDRVLEFKSVGGLLVNKIEFLATKIENSLSNSNGTNGSNDANQAYILLDDADWVSFVQCDITVQERQSAFVLPTLIRVKNGGRLELIGVRFFAGAISSTKVFTTYITAAGNSDFVSLTSVFVNESAAGAFPTTVLTGNNASKPFLSQKAFGFDPFQGSAKVLTDWYTAADWQTGGVLG